MREAELFIQANQLFNQYVAQIKDWDRLVPSTPEWTVRALVNHVTQNNIRLVAVLTGEPAENRDDVLGDDPAAAWTEYADLAEAAAAQVQAGQRVKGFSGDMPIEDFLGPQIGDRLIHAWDLAQGIGVEADLPDGLVTAAYDFIEPNSERLRNSGMFGPAVEVGPDATLQQKLLALSGRDPGYGHAEPAYEPSKPEDIHRGS